MSKLTELTKAEREKFDRRWDTVIQYLQDNPEILLDDPDGWNTCYECHSNLDDRLGDELRQLVIR